MDSPRKSLGQHWLEDQPTLESICHAAELSKSDTVLEIGPGKGSLTSWLMKQAGQVVAVELDEQLVVQLSAMFGDKNLAVVNEDILRFDFSLLPTGYKVVANIPYYLTSNLLRTLSESTNPPTLMVLLVQKEVAERLAAAPGQMSILGISVQLYYETTLGQVVPAHLFTPPPKVDSRVVILRRRTRVLFENLDSQLFFRLVKAGFAARRKKLRSSLSAGLNLDKKETERLLENAGIDPNLRAQDLSLQDWHRLSQACQAKR